MANAYGRVIDGTDLGLDMAEERGILHRDYLAHCLRWSHVAKMLHSGNRYKDTIVLDVGCGCDLPLPSLLHSNRLLCEYVGVDYNPSAKFKDRNWGSMDVTTYGGTIFPRDIKLVGGGYTVGNGEIIHDLPNLITCFEVLEHVEAKHALVMLKAFHKLAVKGDAEVVISTPCWNWKNTAKNHVNEMTHAALGTAIEDVGFEIVQNFGTFGNISDYKDALAHKYGPMGLKLFNDAREYHDTNVLANMFCHQFPDMSRNSLWRLRPAGENYVRKFPTWDTVTEPYTSCPGWMDLSSMGFRKEAGKNDE